MKSQLFQNQHKISFVLLGLLILIAVFGLLVVTFFGIGTSPDSISYLGAAQNLVNGDGLTLPYGEAGNPPLTHHAPLYPLLLALIGLLGFDLAQAARIVNIVLFASNLGLVYLILRSLLPDFSWLPLVGIFLMALSPTMLRIHAMAWSEPLFLFLTFSGLYSLSNYLGGSNRKYLWFSAILLGLAILTRYAGIVLVVIGVVSIILFSQAAVRRKIIDSLAFGGICILPTGLWMVRNSIVAGTAASRDLLFHPIGKPQIFQMIDTFSVWILAPTQFPASYRAILLVGILLIVGWVFITILGKPEEIEIENEAQTNWKQIPIFVKIAVLFIFFYISFLVLSISFIDANIPLDERILSPVFIAGLITILYAFGHLLELVNSPWFVKAIIVSVLIFFSTIYLVNAFEWIKSRQSTGLGYSNRSWQEFEVLGLMNELPAGMMVYTNLPEVVYFYTPHQALRLPRKQYSATKQINTIYMEELDEVRGKLDSSSGVVLFFSLQGRISPAEESQLVDDLRLCLAAGTSDGNLYKLEGPGDTCTLQ